jgi:hypothetical protein
MGKKVKEILLFLLLNKRDVISLQNYKTSIMHAKFLSFRVFTLPVHMSSVLIVRQKNFQTRGLGRHFNGIPMLDRVENMRTINIYYSLLGKP